MLFTPPVGKTTCWAFLVTTLLLIATHHLPPPSRVTLARRASFGPCHFQFTLIAVGRVVKWFAVDWRTRAQELRLARGEGATCGGGEKQERATFPQRRQTFLLQTWFDIQRSAFSAEKSRTASARTYRTRRSANHARRLEFSRLSGLPARRFCSSA